MAIRGWYPDPGGAAGMYRYWDGVAWSEALSTSTAAPAPSPSPYAVNAYRPDPSAYADYQATPQATARRNTAPWIIGTVALLVLALVIYLAVRFVLGAASGGTDNNNTTGNSTTQLCPQEATTNERATHPNDGRVHGGQLSYPKLGTPWSEVTTTDVRIPFGRDVAEQTITIHHAYAGPGADWVISVMVGELYAGDGFYSPQEGSQIVNKCIFGTFYGDAQLGQQTLKSEAYTLDGYNGWITVTNLTFSIPGLATTSEVATVIIVATSAMSSSIFYSSVPNDASQYAPDVDATIAGLAVGP